MDLAQRSRLQLNSIRLERRQTGRNCSNARARWVGSSRVDKVVAVTIPPDPIQLDVIQLNINQSSCGGSDNVGILTGGGVFPVSSPSWPSYPELWELLITRHPATNQQVASLACKGWIQLNSIGYASRTKHSIRTWPSQHINYCTLWGTTNER